MNLLLRVRRPRVASKCRHPVAIPNYVTWSELLSPIYPRTFERIIFLFINNIYNSDLNTFMSPMMVVDSMAAAEELVTVVEQVVAFI